MSKEIYVATQPSPWIFPVNIIIVIRREKRSLRVPKSKRAWYDR